MVVFWLWLGPPMVNGEWKTKGSNTEFLARFGPMFEECRGAGVIMTRCLFLLTESSRVIFVQPDLD